MLHAKRECMRVVSISDVVGRKAERLFTKSFDYVKRVVASFSHSLRFWLSVKFLRHHATDFREKIKRKRQYSDVVICDTLGIPRLAVYRFIKRNPTESLETLIKKYRYLSPIENDPTGKRAYFLKIASNFEDLLKIGYFE